MLRKTISKLKLHLASNEPEVLKKIGKDSLRDGTNKLTTREINRIIKETRASGSGENMKTSEQALKKVGFRPRARIKVTAALIRRGRGVLKRAPQGSRLRFGPEKDRIVTLKLLRG